jgi:anti-sigma-K factor RskA
MYHQQRSRREREPSRHARLEFWLVIIVLIAVVAALAVFLLVYHDVPFRPGGGVG